MLINSAGEEKVNFQSIHLYQISRKSKAGQALITASKATRAAKQIKALEKQGMIFDFVRAVGPQGPIRDSVSFYLGRKPDYFTKDGLNPLFMVARVTNLAEARAFVSQVVKKAKAFLPQHLKHIEDFKKMQ